MEEQQKTVKPVEEEVLDQVTGGVDSVPDEPEIKKPEVTAPPLTATPRFIF